MSKRILVVSQHFWPESFRINDICDGFIEYGLEVDVLCGIPNYPTGQFFNGYGLTKSRRQNKNGIKIRRCFEIKRENNSNIRIFLNYMSFPISSLFSLPYLLRQKYEKIFMYQTSPVMMTLTGILLGKLKRIETTMYVLDLWPENLYSVLKIKNKMLKKFAFRASSWYYHKTDKLIANSQRLLEILKERTNKEDKKITYIPHFCEKIYETSVPDNELSTRFSETFNLIFTGNISPAQSFETVIRAAKKLVNNGYSDIRWIIVGTGMSREWLEGEVQKEGLNECFIFVGQVSTAEIPKYTQIADGLFACLTKSDLLECTLPAKIFSYYAAGKPMIFAMDGEVQQIIKTSKAGYAVNSEDYEGFANAIIKLYQAEDGERTVMGEHAKDYYNKYFERNMNMEKLIGFMFGNEDTCTSQL